LKVLLTHTPLFRRQYYGERSLNGLRAVAEVKLHEADDALDSDGMIAAAGDVDIIVADRLTGGRGEIFARLPKLIAFVRCAVDIRNIDVDAASGAGVLVTRAGPGFVQAVTELALGFMVDLSRGISRATADYQAGRQPEVIMGRQLFGCRLGIIGFGHIGRRLAGIRRMTTRWSQTWPAGSRSSATPRYTSGANRRLSSVSRWQTAALACAVLKSRNPVRTGFFSL